VVWVSYPTYTPATLKNNPTDEVGGTFISNLHT
jgi:hypothetical protein